MSEPQVEVALERVKQGAVEDYAVVVAAYQRRLRAWLAGVCPPSIEPDEIAHLAFIQAYHQIDGYQLGTNFYAWLCAFARNFLRAEIKRLQRREKNQANYLDHLLVENLSQAVEEPPERDQERLAALQACAEELSARSRTVLRERYTQNARLEVLASHLGKTVAAVKFQLFAIRRKLRDCVRRKLGLDHLIPPPIGSQEAL